MSSLEETLSEFIGEIVDEKVIDAVKEALDDINIEVDADHVKGLEDTIQDQLNEFSIDTDSIDGLDRYVESAVKEVLDDATIDAENVKGLDEQVELALEKFFMSEAFQKALTEKVSEAMANVIRNLLQIQVAKPV